MQEYVPSLLTNVIPKIRRSLGHTICEAGLAMHTMEEHVRSTVVLSDGLKLPPVHATTNAGTMAKRTEVAPSMLLFPMTTDLLLTVTAFHLRKSML